VNGSWASTWNRGAVPGRTISTSERTGGTRSLFSGHVLGREISIKAGWIVPQIAVSSGGDDRATKMLEMLEMLEMSKMSMALFRHLTLVRLGSTRSFPSYRLLPTRPA